MNDKKEGYGFIYETSAGYTIGHFSNDRLSGEHLIVKSNQGQISQLSRCGKMYSGINLSLFRNGHLVKGGIGSSSVGVTFPFLSNDYFVGNLSAELSGISNMKSIKFAQGKYFLAEPRQTQDFEEREPQMFEINGVTNLLQVSEIKYNNYQFEKMTERIDRVALDLDLVKLFDSIEMLHPNLFTDLNISVAYFTRRIKASMHNNRLKREQRRTNALFLKQTSLNTSLKDRASQLSGTNYDSFRQGFGDTDSIAVDASRLNGDVSPHKSRIRYWAVRAWCCVFVS